MIHKVEFIVLILIIAGFVTLNKNIGEMVVSDSAQIRKATVVIDAGHGGRDPGKVGVNGALEKDINLQVAKKVKDLLEERKFQVIMTREEDADVDSKRDDMEERVKIINQSEADLAVSVHQNSFSDPEVSGAQVFYYTESDEGEYFAKIMQRELLQLDEFNKRQAKENNNYYLLKKTKVPTIIVECGFLSNPKEAEKLVTEEYQDAVSNAIVRGIESCFGN